MTEPQPFENDLDFVLTWVRFAAARCHRIDFEGRLREAETDPRPGRGVVGPPERTIVKEYTRRLKPIREAETALQAEIEARIIRNRQEGPALAIDRVCGEFGLNELERTVLLMSLIPALGHDFAKMFSSLSSIGFSGDSPTVEGVWAFLGMTPEERVKSRVAFLPTSPLLVNGLVAMAFFPSPVPANLPGASIEITTATFAKLVGMPELASAPSTHDAEDKGR
jgi:hypothetical protein